LTGLIAGQLILHLFYGDDGFFLYSLHFAPLLILLASFSSATKWRMPCLAGAVLVGLGSVGQYRGHPADDSAHTRPAVNGIGCSGFLSRRVGSIMI
jgi:hypothetical protein